MRTPDVVAELFLPGWAVVRNADAYRTTADPARSG
jgi:hypothetical protein